MARPSPPPEPAPPVGREDQAVERAERKDLPEEVRQDLELIARSTERLLDFARETPMQRAPTDVTPLALNALDATGEGGHGVCHPARRRNRAGAFRFSPRRPGARVVRDAAPDSVGRITWVAFLGKNLLPVTIGNIIGGAVFVGVSYWGAFLGAPSGGATPPTRPPKDRFPKRGNRRLCVYISELVSY